MNVNMNSNMSRTGLMLLFALLLAAPALANKEAKRDPFERIYPSQCDDWQERVEQLRESDDSVERSLGELYAQPEHRWCQTRRVRVPPESRWNWDFDFNLPGLDGLAQVLRFLAILGLIGLVIWALVKLHRHVYGSAGGRRSETFTPPDPSYRAIETRQALPGDVPGSARELWQQGRQREAVGLLYRAAVERLLGDGRRGESRTEREVLKLLRGQAPQAETFAYMQRLVAFWQRTAWAGEALDGQDFEALAAAWAEHCSGRSA
jgi:hypothetical protein